MTDATLNMPNALGAGTDWSSTLQNIVAYGAGRIFDANAVSKIYKSTGTPQMMDPFGNVYTAGQPNLNNTQNGTLPMSWLILAGGLVLAFVLLKD